MNKYNGFMFSSDFGLLPLNNLANINNDLGNFSVNVECPLTRIIDNSLFQVLYLKYIIIILGRIFSRNIYKI